MNRIEWTIAAIRILCVWVLIEVVLAIPYSFGSWSALSGVETHETSTSALVGVAVVGFLLPLVGAGIFWSLSSPLAKLIWRDLPGHQARPTPVTAGAMLQAGFIILGLYLVVVTVPAIVEVVLAEVAQTRTFGTDSDLRPQITSEVARLSLQLLLGLALMLKGAGFANLLRSIRGAGLSGK